MKIILILTIISLSFAGFSKAKERSMKVKNRAQKFIQQHKQQYQQQQQQQQQVVASPASNKVIYGSGVQAGAQVDAEDVEEVVIPKRRRNYKIDHSVNYKELSFHLLLVEIKELNEKIVEIEDLVYDNTEILDLQGDIDDIHRRNQESIKNNQDEVKFYVNIALLIIGGIVTIVGGAKGVEKLKRRKNGTSNS